MSRVTILLLVLIAVELGAGIWLIASRLRRPIPPLANWELLDQQTAQQIQSAIETCRSAEDWRTVAELYMAAGCLHQSEACHRVACEMEPQNPQLARQWAFALERVALLAESNAQYERAIELGIRNPDACRYLIARNQLRLDNPVEAGAWFEKGRALPANRYELARLELRAGNLDAAQSHLAELTGKQGQTLQVQLLSYRLALEQGEFRQAARHAAQGRYASEKLQNPFDEEAGRVVRTTALLGLNGVWGDVRAALTSNQLDEADRLLDEVADQAAPQVTELRAEVAFARREYAVAIDQFERFQRRHGRAARIMVRIGDAWDATGDSGQARTYWLQAARLGSGANLKDVHHKLAASFAEAQIKPEADDHLARGHYFVGRDLLQIGHPEKSLDYFAAAVRHDPQFSQAWFYLGEARRMTGKRNAALAAYESCLRLAPHHGRAIAALELMESK